MQAGDTLSWTRTFTIDEVRSFGRLSGDQGTHHVVPDAQGRLMVQGLLTATLPSKIGGDIDFIAGEMLFRFHRPVFTGDTVRCEVTIDAIGMPAAAIVSTAAGLAPTSSEKR
jgi:acyl dehydratase